MIRRRDLLKASGATTAIVGFGSLGRLFSHLGPSLRPVTTPDFVLEFKPDALLARSPQLHLALQECFQYMNQASQGKVLPILSGTAVALERPRIHLALSSPSLKPGPMQASLSYFSRLPQGLSLQEKKNWLTSEVGQNLWQKAYASLDLKPLYFGQGPGTEYQLLSRSPSELLQGSGVLLTRNGDSLRAKFSGKPVRILNTYKNLPSRQKLAFETDALPATTLLEKNLVREGLHFIASDFLSSSVFEMNLSQRAWNSLPRDLQALITQAAVVGGNHLSALLEKKEAVALAHLTLIKDDPWQEQDQQRSRAAFEWISQQPQNQRLAEIYEDFRITSVPVSKKIS